MKPYILQVAHLGKVSEGQYVAHIAILDSDKHCFTGIPYKTIIVDAINEEFARKIADIRIEEMMLNKTSEIDSIYDKNVLIDTKKNYTKKYADLVVEMDKLRAKQDDLLTALVKDAQQDAETGIDIEEMVSQKICQRIKDIDFEPMVAELIGDMIDEQLDDIDIEGEVLGALQEEFED